MSSDLISTNEGFKRELQQLLNRHSIDAATGTPDFLLADFLALALDNYKQLHDATRKWHGVRYPSERQVHVRQPSLVDGPTRAMPVGEVEWGPEVDHTQDWAKGRPRTARTHAEDVARDAARGKLNHSPAPVCQIPDCGCTGKAHP